MLGRLLRVLFGFAVACLAAGLTLVLFVITPSELLGLPPDVLRDRAWKALELAAYVAVQAALFAAPFALVVAALGEALRSRAWTYYVIAALVITGLGFYAQHSTEKVGQPTILNNYAMLAFLTAGVVSGLMYWLLSGRYAGGRQAVAAVGMPVGAGTAVVEPAKGEVAKAAAVGGNVLKDAASKAESMAHGKPVDDGIKGSTAKVVPEVKKP